VPPLPEPERNSVSPSVVNASDWNGRYGKPGGGMKVGYQAGVLQVLLDEADLPDLASPRLIPRSDALMHIDD